LEKKINVHASVHQPTSVLLKNRCVYKKTGEQRKMIGNLGGFKNKSYYLLSVVLVSRIHIKKCRSSKRDETFETFQLRIFSIIRTF
jgi:hypothetical protein